jgi:hypothetical protein
MADMALATPLHTKADPWDILGSSLPTKTHDMMELKWDDFTRKTHRKTIGKW